MKAAIKKMVVLVACFAICVFLFVDLQAKKPEFKPLYQDSTGWFVSKAISGSDVLSAYKFTPEGYDKMKMRGAERYCPAQLSYLYENCPAFYYLFFLAIPDGIIINLNDKTLFDLKYVCGKDTLRLHSSELFFATIAKPNRLVFVSATKSGILVPNPDVYSQQTWTDKKTGVEYSLPAVFVRFEFRKMPDKLLSCPVSNVPVFQKAVNFR